MDFAGGAGRFPAADTEPASKLNSNAQIEFDVVEHAFTSCS
jgi:hypothetical protein